MHHFADTQFGRNARYSRRALMLDSVKVVAKDTAKEIVAALGGKADAKSITAAVTQRLKG